MRRGGRADSLARSQASSSASDSSSFCPSSFSPSREQLGRDLWVQGGTPDLISRGQLGQFRPGSRRAGFRARAQMGY